MNELSETKGKPKASRVDKLFTFIHQIRTQMNLQFYPDHVKNHLIIKYLLLRSIIFYALQKEIKLNEKKYFNDINKSFNLY